ncbi:MAG: anaerobic ribonucleoside-triphosphate reductase activating protein [Candidatus Omnitrophica bacterium]|nr:anaerobic ribonucleoside-triphosphate reductase activating protein [Candidatus Omnitrophota bacterium]
MKIGGLLKFSLIDYPGKMAAVIFTQGCNFHCPYCHNPELVDPQRFCAPIADDKVFDFLKKRIGQIEGLVVTGGEPTLQKDLIEFLKKVKQMGYCVKLDTNGSNPDALKEVLRLNLVDYIAMDIKAPLEKYSQLTALRNCDKRVKESIQIILDSELAYEFRTTLAAPIVSAEDLPKMVSLIEGAKKYRLQRFIPRDNILNKGLFEESPENFSEEEVASLQSMWGVGGS